MNWSFGTIFICIWAAVFIIGTLVDLLLKGYIEESGVYSWERECYFAYMGAIFPVIVAIAPFVIVGYGIIYLGKCIYKIQKRFK